MARRGIPPGGMGAIKVGIFQEEVIRAFGKPDSIKIDPTREKMTVLAYGDFQFHFNPHHKRLAVIYAPDTDRIPG